MGGKGSGAPGRKRKPGGGRAKTKVEICRGYEFALSRIDQDGQVAPLQTGEIAGVGGGRGTDWYFVVFLDDGTSIQCFVRPKRRTRKKAS